MCVFFFFFFCLFFFFLFCFGGGGGDSGSEFQTVGPKTEKDLFPKSLKRKARNCQQRGVKRAQRPRETVLMKKIRNIKWHSVLIDTLKTETSNFVLNPSLQWQPVERSEQCCCTCLHGLTEDKWGCMILYVLKLIRFVVRDTS